MPNPKPTAAAARKVLPITRLANIETKVDRLAAALAEVAAAQGEITRLLANGSAPHAKPNGHASEQDWRSQIVVTPSAQDAPRVVRAPSHEFRTAMALAERHGSYTDQLARESEILASPAAGVLIDDAPPLAVTAFPDLATELLAYAEEDETPPPPPNDDEMEGIWTRRLNLYRGQGMWHDSWGAKPGQPGCEAPDHLVSARR